MPRFKRYDYGRMAARCLAEFSEPYSVTTVAVDTETEGFAWHAPAFCVTLTWRAPGGKLLSFYIDLESDEAGTRREIVRRVLSGIPVWVFHNAKFDLQKLLLMGCIDREWIDMHPNEGRIEDTNIIHALIDENDRHGLKYLAAKLLGESTNEDKVLAKVRRKLKIKKDEGYHLLPREVVVPYALRDTEYTLRLYEALRPYIASRDMQALYDAELATAIALLDIEANGIALDVPYLSKTASEYGAELMKLTLKLEKLTFDPDHEGEQPTFNPNSPKQIIEAFERRGVKTDKTDKATLQAMDDPLAKTLLDYRRVKKLHATYLLGMLNEQVGGILHPNFNLTLPRTGRMSSSAATNN